MTNLRKLAEGKPCLIRVPGYCNGNWLTTVLCHLRMIGISGGGMKSPDVLGAHGCGSCHDVVDGKTKTEFTYDERRLMLLEGIARTQDWYVSEGILIW